VALENPQSADHIAGEQGSFEPQRMNNFSVEIPLGDADRDLIEMGLKGFSLPSATNEIITVNYQNETRKVAGQVNVEEGNLALHDFVDADVRGAILRWRQLVYQVRTGNIGYAKDYKKTLNVLLKGPDGQKIRIAKLIGTWPTQDPPADLDMESPDKLLMEVPLSVDKIDWSDSIDGL